MQGMMALLLVVASEVAAQGLPGGSGIGGSIPSLALGLSPDGARALAEEFDEHRLALDAFGRKTNMDRFKDGGYERVKPWTLYGRLGVLNFQDTIDPSRSNGGQISFRRQGPKLTGRYYVGIHRTF